MVGKKGVLSKHKKSGERKKGVPKDFVNEKQKVGKKKKAPKAETKTAFTVKRLNVPAQPALNQKPAEVTHRNLGLLELVAHLQHHSGKVRKEALTGLRELCEKHEGVLKSNLARIMEATTSMPTDSDCDVRREFHLLQTFLLGAASREAVLAFAPTLTLHVRSALSHVSSEVCTDGLALLDAYLKGLGGAALFSETEVARLLEVLCQMMGQMGAVLPCLLQLLSWKSVSAGVQADEGAVSGGDCAAIGSIGGGHHAAQLSMYSVLQGRFDPDDLTGGGTCLWLGANSGASSPPQLAAAKGEESPIWKHCLHCWHQAGEFKPTSGETGEAFAKPGWIKLQCAAVLERALSSTAGGNLWATLMTPSASQVSSLALLVKRGEWPLQVDAEHKLRALADSVNFRMARVFAQVALRFVESSEVPRPHLARLAAAAVAFLEEGSQAALASRGGVSVGGVIKDLEELLVLGAGRARHVLSTLDLLWACAARQRQRQGSGRAEAAHGDGARPAVHALPPVLEADDIKSLVATTSRYATRDPAGTPPSRAAAVLAAPLVASLLGLRPSSAGGAPKLLRGVWPVALAGLGEPELACMVEEATATAWVTAWPRLLWHLGGDDAELSALLLRFLIQLAKRAVATGSFHEQLFQKTCPLLAPFLGGLRGAPRKEKEEEEEEERPPPLALLPTGWAGPQCLAATLLQHVPKLSEPLARLLTRVICRWSDIGLVGDSSAGGAAPAHRLGAECCELLLRVVLSGETAAPPPRALAFRARICISLLCAGPSASASAPVPALIAAVRMEHAATRLAAAVAEWIMQDCAPRIQEMLPGSTTGQGELALEARRQLAFVSFAWPLCKKILAAAPRLAHRGLCLLYFCRAAAGPGATASGPGQGGAAAAPSSLHRQSILLEMFDWMVLRSSGSSICSLERFQTCCGSSPSAALATPLWDEGRGGPLLSSDAALQSLAPRESHKPDARHRLGRMFVEVWMHMVPETQREFAYEYLVKLCGEQLAQEDSRCKRRRVSEPGTAHGAADVVVVASAGSLESGGASSDVVLATATLLVEAITYRNAQSLPTGAWNTCVLPGARGEPLPSRSPAALREEVEGFLQASAASAAARDHHDDDRRGSERDCLVRLAAMLPLL